MKKRFVDFLAASIGCALALHCAGQAPPPGGPPDTIPPEVISVYPEQNTTEFRDRRIVLEFSEYVDRRSFEESIFFSPAVGSVEFDWSGTEVEIKLDEPLHENVTYVVTVGTDVVDIRNRNRMAESFSLAFSTGATIDSALIGGKVFDPKPEGITVFAYLLGKRSADTLNPTTLRPDYVTQTGKDGSFRLSHLAWGRYRLFAVRDEFKNYLYDPQVDLIGTASEDFDVNSARKEVDRVQFRLTKEDTTAPFLLDAKSETATLVRLRFSEPLDTATIGTFSISDTLTNTRIEQSQMVFAPIAPSVVELRTPALDSTRVYRVIVHDVRDTAGNSISVSARSAFFQGTAAIDTVPPRTTWANVKDSLRNVRYDFSIDLHFSEGVRQSPLHNGLRLLDSAGTPVAGRVRWFDHTGVRYAPSEELRPLAWYVVRLQLDSVQDFSGNRLKDSTVVLRFQTIDRRKLGSIRGRVEDVEAGSGGVYVFATNLSEKTPRMKKLEDLGEFTFESLAEGQYVLNAFRDTDGSGEYTFGRAAPFSHAERFAVYPDTIKVRARWPVEGVILRFGAY